MPVKIVTDSTSDLKPEIASDLGITVVPLYINFGTKSYRDGVDLTLRNSTRSLHPAKPYLPPQSLVLLHSLKFTTS